MSHDELTSDNSHLSEIKIAAPELPAACAVNCTTSSRTTDEFVRSSISENTRRAYISDVTRFHAWGGAIPSTDEIVAEYLAEHAETHATSTLARWVASIAKAHRAAGLPDPTKGELVRAVLRGIRRVRGSAPHQAKPLLREDLFLTLDRMGRGHRDIRDRALLLIGFAGGFRRSELVALECADLDPVRQGMIIWIRRSKTDQLGAGRKIGIPYGRGRYCPVRALDEWLSVSGILEGSLFRPISRHRDIGPSALSGDAVSLILRHRLRGAGIDPAGYSGHSLRAGFATSAAQAGVPSWKIRQQTGHASDAMLSRYIRDGDLFADNAAAALF